MKYTHFSYLCFLLFAWACSTEHPKTEEIRSVKCDTVRIENSFQEKSFFPGRIKAASDVNLAFRVSGTLERIPVREGDFVRKGTLLAKLDARDYRTQLSATQAEYHQIKGEAERIIELYAQESVSKNDYEKATYGLQQISAKLEAHQNALKDTELTAPFDGYIQKILFDEHETVSAGFPIVAMISSHIPEVEINIPTADFIKRTQMKSAVCTIDIFPDQEFPLSLIGINQKANLNQLYTTRFQLAETHNASPAPGMSALVTIYYEPKEQHCVRVPLSALVGEGENCHIWRFDPQTQTVKSVPVQVTSITTQGFAILSEGVSPGEIIVSAGANSLSEGQKVKPIAATPKTNVGGLL